MVHDRIGLPPDVPAVAPEALILAGVGYILIAKITGSCARTIGSGG